jgi:predicted nucleic acid-binding protein
MIMSKIAVDTNILIYLHEIDPESGKRRIANELIADGPLISSQVVSEYLNVCRRRLKMTKEDSLDSLTGWLPFCRLAVFELTIFTSFIRLVEKYQFQIFDAIVVAYALEAGCSILYSEDMHHNLLVEKQLRIINPFL